MVDIEVSSANGFDGCLLINCREELVIQNAMNLTNSKVVLSQM